MSDDKQGRQTPDQAARGGSVRYGTAHGASGSGHQESKKIERKEEAGRFRSRQGGDQSQGGAAEDRT